MLVYEAVILVLITAVVTGVLVTAVYYQKMRYLRRENQLLRRLFSEQAKLHEMSLDAYIAMLQEAQRHTQGR